MGRVKTDARVRAWVLLGLVSVVLAGVGFGVLFTAAARRVVWIPEKDYGVVVNVLTGSVRYVFPK